MTFLLKNHAHLMGGLDYLFINNTFYNGSYVISPLERDAVLFLKLSSLFACQLQTAEDRYLLSFYDKKVTNLVFFLNQSNLIYIYYEIIHISFYVFS